MLLNKLFPIFTILAVCFTTNLKLAHGANLESSEQSEQSEIIAQFFKTLDDLYKINGQTLDPDTIRLLSLEINQQLQLDSHLKYTNSDAKEKIKEILEIICSMHWLRQLSIKNCQLTSLPENIANLRHLQGLNLKNNALVDLPASLIKLKELSYLSIPGNPFKAIPIVLGKLRLESLEIDKFDEDIKNKDQIKEFENLGYINIFADQNTKTLKFTSVYKKIISDLERGNFNNLVYSDLPREKEDTISASINISPEMLVSEVIFNDANIEKKIFRYNSKCQGNDHEFNQWKKLRSKNSILFKEGPALFLDKGEYTITDSENSEQTKLVTIRHKIPIGYTVLLPKSKIIRASCIKVYGGGLWGIPFKRGIDEILLANDIAVIYINALDIYQLNEYQLNMDKELYELVNMSIHKVFETIKNNPKKMGITDYKLGSEFMTRKKYLYGTSFGGGLCIRHGELYPKTFNGYISVEGILDFTAAEQTYSKAFRKVYDRLLDKSLNSFKWLDPSRFDALAKLERPALIIQNFDDNSVNYQVASAFRTKAQEKEIYFLHFPRGNINNKLTHEHYKGHFPPTSTQSFERLVEGLVGFILNGTLDNYDGKVHDWEIDLFKIYADAFMNSGYNTRLLKDKFISWAMRFNEYQKILSSNDKILIEEVHPSWKAFEIKGVDENHIYDALALLETDNRAHHLTNLSDEAIINMLKQHIPLHIDYINEMFETNFVADNVLKAMLMDSNLINAIRDFFLEKSPYESNSKDSLLRNLFLFNPSLVHDFALQMSQDQNYQQRKMIAMNELMETIHSIDERSLKNPPHRGPTAAAPKPARSQFVKKLRAFCARYEHLAVKTTTVKICQLAKSDTLRENSWEDNDIRSAILSDLKLFKTGKIPKDYEIPLYRERIIISEEEMKKLEKLAEKLGFSYHTY